MDFQAEVLGQGRLGVRLASLIATLRTVMRLPIRQLRDLLRLLHGLEVSSGESVEVLHWISKQAQPVLDDLLTTIRASPAVQADDTGWREDGLTGEIWSVSPPTIRSDESHHSRAGEVEKPVSGNSSRVCWGAIVPQDTPSMPDCINDGGHLSCAIGMTSSKRFRTRRLCSRRATSLNVISDDAVAWARLAPDPHLTPHAQHQAREVQHHAFEQRVWERCQPFLQKEVP